MFFLRRGKEEEEGSDEDYTNHHQPAPPPCRVTWQAANEEDSDRDSDPALVSPIVEVKDVREKSPITVINLHEASRYTSSHHEDTYLEKVKCDQSIGFP